MSDKVIPFPEGGHNHKEGEPCNCEGPMALVGFEDCLIGTSMRFGMAEAVYCYDVDMILDNLVKNSNPRMSYDDAFEYFDFNILGSWVGDGTPIFFWKKGDEDVQRTEGDPPTGTRKLDGKARVIRIDRQGDKPGREDKEKV